MGSVEYSPFLQKPDAKPDAKLEIEKRRVRAIVGGTARRGRERHTQALFINILQRHSERQEESEGVVQVSDTVLGQPECADGLRDGQPGRGVKDFDKDVRGDR